MFTDPVVVTYSASPTDCARIRIGASDATYQNADNWARLRISHQVSKTRTRRMIRLEVDKIGESPVTGSNQKYTTSCYIVVDEPSFVFTRAQILDIVEALLVFCSDSSSANMVKVLANEV